MKAVQLVERLAGYCHLRWRHIRDVMDIGSTKQRHDNSAVSLLEKKLNNDNHWLSTS